MIAELSTDNEKLHQIFLRLSMDSLLNDLKDLPLKINDDLYFYSSNKQLNNGVEGMLKMWEYYEIHYTRPRKLLPYGNWSEANGLQLPKDEKWVRRRNLEVRRKKLREKKLRKKI